MKNNYTVRNDGTVRIELRRRNAASLFAVVDWESLHVLLMTNCTWISQDAKTSQTRYASALLREEGRLQKIYMHRLITGARPGTEVDHKDHDGLNNRLSNLSVGSKAKNQQNRKGSRFGSKSGIPNVNYWSLRDRWQARIMRDGKLHHLGTFKTMEEAAIAVKRFHEDRNAQV